MNWTSIEQIQDVKIILENGQTVGEIYGNGLNCVTVFISFLALSAQGVVDLQGVNLTSIVHLTDYVTGNILPYSAKENASLLEQPGLYYSSSRSKFCQPLPSALSSIDVPGEDPNLGRGNIIYYLYGKSDVEITRQVGVMAKLHRRYVYVSKHRALLHKVDIVVKPPITYIKADLEYSWNPIITSGSVTQDNLNFKLNKNISTGWAGHDFVNCSRFVDNLCHVYTQTVDEPDPSYSSYSSYETKRSSYSYLYFYAPIGKQGSAILKLEDAAAEQESSFDLVYNHLPGQFDLVRVKVKRSAYKVKNFDSKVTLRLYDTYGNSGHFAFSYENASSPDMRTQNY